jgi:glycosyltransferase involved in cell wall biosynthesis
LPKNLPSKCPEYELSSHKQQQGARTATRVRLLPSGETLSTGDRMKLAMVDFSRGWGGAEQVLLSICIGLKKRGFDIGVFLREDASNSAKFREAGFDTWEIPRSGFAAVKGMLCLARIARKQRFNIVHVHRNHDLLTGKFISVLSGRSPLVATQHCLLGRTSFAIMNLADLIVPVSRFIADGISDTFPRLGNKIRVIHNGVNFNVFENAKRDYWSKRTELTGKGPFLGVTGYFYKNQEELIELLPRIQNVFPQVVLVIIGHGGKINMIEKKIMDVGCGDSVYFAGYIPYEEMKHALASLDLQVSAFRKEGFGLSVIEGMAVGPPFVGYRAGGYQEIIVNGNNGYLVDNQEEMLEAVLKLLREQRLLQAFRDNSGAYVRERFSLENMLIGYESLYAELIRSPC